MSNAPDNYENIKAIHQEFYSEIEELMNNTSPCGYQIHCILGRLIYHHL